MKTELITLLFVCSSLSAQTVPFEVLAVSDLVKVFADGYRLDGPKATIDLFGIKDEILSAQFVIQARVDLKEVSVMTFDLRSDEGNAVIPASTLRYNFVKSVPLTKNSDPERCLARIVFRSHQGRVGKILSVSHGTNPGLSARDAKDLASLYDKLVPCDQRVS